MDPTERFTELVQRDERDVPLDEAALLIAAHHHHVDVPEQLARFDTLASHAPPAPDALATYLFVERGFAGNSVDYADPHNSFLDDVLERRLGLPITLSVLMLEVGRRVGLTLDGVGMPGHFLVRADAGAFFDPFHGGERLDEDGCRERFSATQGDAPFLPAYLAPVGSHAILARMLANLVRSFVTRDPNNAVWTVRLRLRVPGVSPAERREAATLLGTLGRFEEAAEELSAIAEELDGPAAARLEQDAAAYRRVRTEGPPQMLDELPMFPLGSVLFPHAVLPLHVFEPRYRALTEHCLASDREFGVVLIERGHEVGGGDARFDTGTVARIVEAGQLDDGRWVLVSIGVQRLRVHEWLADDPYPLARVERLAHDDGVGVTPALVDDVAALLRRVLAMHAELGDPVAPFDVVLDDDPVQASFEASALAPIGSLDAQHLLEIDDAEGRLTRLHAMLQEECDVLELRLSGE